MLGEFLLSLPTLLLIELKNFIGFDLALQTILNLLENHLHYLHFLSFDNFLLV